MKEYDNSSFYHSKEWRKISALYMASQNYICERCGRSATICHHRKHLNGENVHDPEVALSFSNLESLCLRCHNQEHFSDDRIVFNSSGDVIGVRKTDEEKQFEADQRKIDELLSKMTVQNGSESIFSDIHEQDSTEE